MPTLVAFETIPYTLMVAPDFVAFDVTFALIPRTSIVPRVCIID